MLYLFKVFSKRLERWLSCSENLMLFQRTEVQFLAPTSGAPHPSVIQLPENSPLSSDFCRFCKHTASIHTGTCTYINEFFKVFSKFLKMFY